MSHHETYFKLTLLGQVNFVVAGPEQPLVDGIQPAFKKSKYAAHLHVKIF